jgi:hypothetical protein
MIVADAAIGAMLSSFALLIEIALTAGVVAVGYWLKKRRGESEPAEQPE